MSHASRTDTHQHLWSEPLLAALAQRTSAPCLKRRRDGWWLRAPGEPETRFDFRDHDPDLRAAELRNGGFDRAWIAPSLPLGIESLAGDAAEELVAIHNATASALPPCFDVWATVPAGPTDPRSLDRLLDDDRTVGLSLPADALASRAGLEDHGPLLEILERRGRPLFVHPGPAHRAAADRSGLGWWNAMTAYPAELNAAWHAFVAFGRSAHPRLHTLYAAIAGGAPLHIERLAARGGPADSALDGSIFYDTSSYGERATDALVRAVGVDQIVYGSDLPVVATAGWGLGDAVLKLATVENPARLAGSAPAMRVAA